MSEVGAAAEWQTTPVSQDVSVVMGCFNCAERIEATVRSVQEQTLATWELIAVDDGSSDETGKILDQMAETDRRIRVIHQPNAGLTRALIRGVQESRSPLIARLDAGDQCLPLRLETQKRYLDHHPEVVAVGSGVQLIGPENEPLGQWVRSGDALRISQELTDQSIGFVHPSVMFRRDAYEQAGGYRPQFRYAQDHDLWYRLVEIGQLGTCPEILLEFRHDIAGISPENRQVQRQLGELARACYVARRRGLPEEPHLAEAETLSQKRNAGSLKSKEKARGAAAYFVGSQLFRNRDPRCRRYLAIAIRTMEHPMKSLLKYAYAGSFVARQ